MTPAAVNNDTPPEQIPYQLLQALIAAARRELEYCETTVDPAESRHRFDVIRRLARELEKQVHRIPDPAERRTLLQQSDALRELGKSIAPSIPYICRKCLGEWLPETGPAAKLCRNCTEQERD